MTNELMTLPTAAVFTRGVDVLTSSRIVAEVFEKRHDNVLRDIDALIISSELRTCSAWFRPVISETVIGNGAIRRDRAFDMTRDGLTLLAMGFTGAKALRFKMLYIQAFNEMEQRLRQPPADLNNPATLRQLLLGYTETVERLTARVEHVEAERDALAPLAAVTSETFNLNRMPTLTDVLRKFDGVNTNATPGALCAMGDFWRCGKAYRVARASGMGRYYQEKWERNKYGSRLTAIIVTPDGVVRLTKLYQSGRLPMLNGHGFSVALALAS